MRFVGLFVVALGLGITGCATKPKPIATATACPPLTLERWSPAVRDAISATFGAELKRRFGATGRHVLIDRDTDSRGDLVVTANRIGPAKFEMPEPGKGGGVMVVLQTCTAKVLRVRKLTELEANPLPRASSEDAGT